MILSKNITLNSGMNKELFEKKRRLTYESEEFLLDFLDSLL